MTVILLGDHPGIHLGFHEGCQEAFVIFAY